MPQQIELSGNRSIQNMYATDGRKLKTTVKEGEQIMDGTKYYNANFVFDKQKEMEYILFDEGRIVNYGGNLEYEYHLKDHLGSVRVAFEPSTNGTAVVQENAYYPFGAPIAEFSYNATDNKNRYLREGKEYIDDFDWNKYDFLARTFDSWILQPLQIDPLCEKYYHISPYAYCGNNPVKYVDPDGRDYILKIDHEKQKITIEAKYYASTKDVESAQQAVDFWNNLSGTFSFDTDEGSYSIDFSLSVEEVETNSSMSNDEIFKTVAKAANSDYSGGVNMYSVNDKLNEGENGSTSGGNLIKVRRDRKTEGTGAHEVGHTLGMGHSQYGIMSDKDDPSKRSNFVYNESINDMVKYPLNGNPKVAPSGYKMGRGTVIQEGFQKNIKGGKIKRHKVKQQ